MNLNNMKFSAIMMVLALVFAVQTKAGSDRTISIMAYNVENLFDAEHDEGKDDFTFLPIGFPDKERRCRGQANPYYVEMCLKTDWTPDKVEVKLLTLKRMLTHMGYLPDIVGLEEVENKSVVGRLAQAAGYRKFLITESPDKRGIDVALLFNEDKLEYLDHEEIVIESEKTPLKTRNILRVNFHMKGAGLTLEGKEPVLGVYVNHWPSQEKDSKFRMLAADFLKDDILKQRRRHGAANYYVVAMGDFNTTEREEPNAISDYIANPESKASLIDVQTALDFGGRRKPSPYPQTYFYRSRFNWERFDRILVSRNMFEKAGVVQANAETFKVVKPAFATYDYTEQNPKNRNHGKTMPSVPRSYDHNSTDPETAGYSDHFPVYLELEVR